VKLPNSDRAFIEPTKISGYLLSGSHPVGRFKASFFFSLGYTEHQWERLRNDLLALVLTNEAEPGNESVFGRKYEVGGMLVGPSGRSAEIRTVWIVEKEGAPPRFVTAYPG
jgi:hypothetical protein